MSAIYHLSQTQPAPTQQLAKGGLDTVRAVGKIAAAAAFDLGVASVVGLAIAGVLSVGPLASLSKLGYAVIAGGVVLEVAAWIILSKSLTSSRPRQFQDEIDRPEGEDFRDTNLFGKDLFAGIPDPTSPILHPRSI